MSKLVVAIPSQPVQEDESDDVAQQLGDGGEEEVEVDVSSQARHVQAQAVVHHRYHHPAETYKKNEVCWLVGCLAGCLTFQRHASVSQGRICSDNFTCCHTEIEVADPTFYLTQSQYTDTGPTIPSADPITPGAWQGSHWSTNS